MQTGIVKWFNNTKGYGFILSESGGGDIFAHYSAIDMDGYKTLKAGQTVQFDTEQGPKGLHAKHIQAGADAARSQQDLAEAALPSLSEAQLSEA
jgi:CspA family cold shock protein